MAISSIWSGSGSSLSSLLSAATQYNVSRNINYEVLAKRLWESSTAASSGKPSDSTKVSENGKSGTAASSGTTGSAVSSAEKSSDSSSGSSNTITDLYEKTQKTYQEQDDLAFLSYYAKGAGIKTEGASERASLIRSLLNGTTGNIFDAYA